MNYNKSNHINSSAFYFKCLMLIMLFGSSQFATAQIDFKSGSLKKMLNKAKKSDKLIFVDCYTEWCGPCKWMDKNVFCQDEADEFFNENFINWKLDMESTTGKEITRLYSVSAFPTFLFLDGEGKLVHQAYGVLDLEAFMRVGHEATIDTLQLLHFETAYQSDHYSSDLLYGYASLLDRNRLKGAQDIANEYFDRTSDWDNERDMKFLYSFVNMDIASRPYQYLINHKEDFYKYINHKEVNEKIKEVIIGNMGPDPDITLAKETIKQAFGDSSTYFGDQTLLAALDAKSSFEYKEEFVFRAIQYVKNYPDLSWSELNDYAWLIAEKTDDTLFLTEAKNVAVKSVNKRESYFNYDTISYICYKLNQLDEAKKYAVKAIELANAVGANYGDTQLLLRDIIIAKAAADQKLGQ